MRFPRRVLAPVVLVTSLLVGGTALATNGVDVSRYQHPHGTAIDWRAVKASGQTFTFIKASEGTTVRNGHFAADWKAAKAAGLYRGAYHFARPSRAKGSAVAQANAFVKAIGNQRTPGTLPPVLDLESNTARMRPAELAVWTRAFLTTVEQKTGRKPMIYTYPAFWSASMGATTAFAGYPLWIAHYTSAKAPRTPGWSSWTFWQYTSSGSVRGIRGDVDRNRFRGSAAQLATLALSPAPAKPGGATPSPTLEQLFTDLGLGSLVTGSG
jgi:GH25 family lysozyme M1 (1,4-beta-N-acetylmuramidase)